MASVTGSRLAFFNPGFTPDKINVVLTTDGNTLLSPTVSGAFNIEVFTATAGVLGAGFQASAFIQDAGPLTNNQIQAGALNSTERLLAGNFQIIDSTGGELIQIAGSGSDTVTGSAGDTVTGSSVAGSSQLIDLSATNASAPPNNVKAGAMTAIGGAGNTTVWAGNGDSITGGSGPMTVSGAAASNVKITGGAGNLSVFNLIGTGSSINGSTSGWTYVDDSYVGSGNNTIGGGAGNGGGADPQGGAFTQGSNIFAGPGDTILGGSGTMLVTLNKPNVTGVSVGGGSGAATVTGGPGDTVTGASGALQFNKGTNSSVSGGTGALNVFDLNSGNTITGGSSNTTVPAGNLTSPNFIDDSYSAGGRNMLIGGAGAARIIGGSGDTIVAGTGALQAEIKTGFGTETVNLSAAARAAANVREVASVTGGTAATVTGFNAAIDTIQSATNVTGTTLSGGATSTVVGSNTVLTFSDGNTLTIVGITAGIKFST